MVADIPEGERSILLKFEQKAVPQIEMGSSKGLYSLVCNRSCNIHTAMQNANNLNLIRRLDSTENNVLFKFKASYFAFKVKIQSPDLWLLTENSACANDVEVILISSFF
jgi:hypothetical protein